MNNFLAYELRENVQNYAFFFERIIFKNVSCFTSYKKLCLYFRLSFRELKKILPSTFIYISILIEICMNTNIMNTQIFHLNDLIALIEGHKRSLLHLILTFTYVLINNFFPLFSRRLLAFVQVSILYLFSR